ncbi:MAG: hypothetical protein F7B18_08875 [Desulfurococcales archaeon]|nr:hypothetical protein [Desulfurococcales archaeon]
MARVRVVVEAEIRPTEDPDKVLKAVESFFTPDTVRVEDLGSTRILVAEAGSLRSLEKLHWLLRAERILDAARGMLRRGIHGDRLVFHLHKQAAYVGRLSFVSGDHESPMGAIRITVEHPDPRQVVDWLAPPTVRGRPVFEKPMPE